MDRRPLTSRSASWAQAAARGLAGLGLSPNQISVIGVLFAAGAGGCFVGAGWTEGVARAVLLVAAAVGIQLRLLCNLFDGMVAIEHDRKSPTGDIYNDAPDRFEDLFILVGAGYAAAAWPWAAAIGWAAGAVAVLTAYVRLLGAALGQPHDFRGPMAKPHRMFVATVAALAAAGLEFAGYADHALVGGLGLIVVLGLVTVARRLLGLGRSLRG